ncbi:MBL fold metallo-hydrolase [bacterium]|nr:MBL fold metallo-hydrolase [bacterium]
MLHFEYYAHACFLLHFGDLKILMDPYTPEIGYKMPERPADYVCISHEHFDHNYVAAVSGRTTVLRGGVSRRLGPVTLTAVLADHDDDGQRGLVTLFKLQAGQGPSIVHLSDLGTVLTQEQLSELGPCDVALVPIGGCGNTLDAAGAMRVAEQLKSRLVVPMHYRTPFLSRTLFPGCDGLENFLKLAKASYAIERASEGVVRMEKLPDRPTVLVVPHLY